MKKLLLPLLISIPGYALGSDFVQDLEKIQETIAQQEIDEFLKNPTPEGIPGPFLHSLLPKENIDPEKVCDEEKEKKKSRYELVIIAETNVSDSSLTQKPGQGTVLKTNELRILKNDIPYNALSMGFSPESITQRAKDIWESGKITNLPSPQFDINTPLGRDLFIDSMITAAANSPLSEADLSRSLAGVIESKFKTEEEKYLALSGLSSRLYVNYNNARNPGYNNPKNNPFNAPIPEGDMTINDLLTATANYDVFSGGVCNDIAEALAMVGEHLFPDKDVLTVNAGSHFGLLITDGKKTRVIDGIVNMEMENRLVLHSKLSPTNMRINKVVNGVQQEIAVIDTEMGQVMAQAFQTNKKLLKTDPDISSIMAHLKKENFGVTVGTADLTDSQVVVVVAKYEYQGEKWKSYAGTGLSAQKFDNGNDNRYQVHVALGAERNMFSYVNQSTEVNFASGVRLSGMYAINQPRNSLGGYSVIDMSGAMDVYNRVDANFGSKDPDGVKVRSSIEVEHTLGPSNWGETTGAMSYMEPKDTPAILKNMEFHLNQVNAEISVEKNLSSRVTGMTRVDYQGSNIGQSVGVLAGLNIKVPNGAQLLVFTGYKNADIPGYKTQHSLFANQSGGQIGAKYRTKNGVEFGAAVREISGGKASVNATIKVPLK